MALKANEDENLPLHLRCRDKACCSRGELCFLITDGQEGRSSCKGSPRVSAALLAFIPALCSAQNQRLQIKNSGDRLDVTALERPRKQVFIERDAC